MRTTMQAITPMLWFDGTAEDATNLYVSIFPNSKITKVLRCGDAGPGPKGSVLTTEFVLNGQEFTALNGGPLYKFTEAVSFVIHCDTQAEVDHYWDRLLDGGTAQACGWLKDKFGLSWQITPRVLIKYMNDPDAAIAGRVLQAMMGMVKLDIAAIEAAAAG